MTFAAAAREECLRPFWQSRPRSPLARGDLCHSTSFPIGEDDDLTTPSEGDCTKPTVTKLNEGLTLDLICTDAQGNKQTIGASFVGNFTERYSATPSRPLSIRRSAASRTWA